MTLLLVAILAAERRKDSCENLLFFENFSVVLGIIGATEVLSSTTEFQSTCSANIVPFHELLHYATDQDIAYQSLTFQSPKNYF